MTVISPGFRYLANSFYFFAEKLTSKLTIKFNSFGCSREHLDLQFSFVVSGKKNWAVVQLDILLILHKICPRNVLGGFKSGDLKGINVNY